MIAKKEYFLFEIRECKQKRLRWRLRNLYVLNDPGGIRTRNILFRQEGALSVELQGHVRNLNSSALKFFVRKFSVDNVNTK